MKVLFDKLAKAEMDDASEYYELEVPGLGSQFRQEVKNGIRRIREYPTAWPKERGDVRRHLGDKNLLEMGRSIGETGLCVKAKPGTAC